MYKAGIVSLGCPRNLVDSEIMLGSLRKAGFKIVDAEKSPDAIIINTCSFIGPAREESIDAILEASLLKSEGKIKRLIVCGCLAQMHKRKLINDIPEVDLVLGTGDFSEIGNAVFRLFSEGKKSGADAVSAESVYLYDECSPRLLLTPRHYAYIKIAEGCSNFCSYCIISKLRGRFRSRSIDSVIKEVERLSESGRLREINIIGQDTTIFGIDRYGKSALAELLRRICRSSSSARWVRVLYTHPAHYNDELIRTIADEKKVCKYLDLPIQHMSDNVLKRMNRHTTKDEILNLIDKLRRKIPGLVLRTSVIVGFPGESDKDFNELLHCLKDIRFERCGAFMYSCESGTKASRLSAHVTEKVKKERFEEVMRLQREISRDRNRRYLNRRIEALVDEKIENERGLFIGRTQGDAPDIDGNVYLSGEGIEVGEFCKAKIIDTLEYDLVGEVT